MLCSTLSNDFYFVFFPVPVGSIPELPAETCNEIKASEGQTVSKKYWLSTIKPGIPLLAHCDMETGGEYDMGYVSGR